MFLFKLEFSPLIGPGVGLLGHMDGSAFSFLRNLLTVLHTGCSNSHSPHSLQCLLFVDFFWWWRRYLTVGLICIPLEVNMEKAMAPHSSTLAWKIPWTEEPGRLQSMESLRVGQDWATSLSLFTFMHWRRTWQPTPVFLPGKSQGRGLLSMGLHRVGYDWSDLAAAARINKTEHFSYGFWPPRRHLWRCTVSMKEAEGGRFRIQHFGKLGNCSRKQLPHLTVPPALFSRFGFLYSLSALHLFLKINFSQLGFAVVSHCGFDQPFPVAQC